MPTASALGSARGLPLLNLFLQQARDSKEAMDRYITETVKAQTPSGPPRAPSTS